MRKLFIFPYLSENIIHLQKYLPIAYFVENMGFRLYSVNWHADCTIGRMEGKKYLSSLPLVQSVPYPGTDFFFKC